MEQALFQQDLAMLMVRHGITEITGMMDINDQQTAVFRHSLSEVPNPIVKEIEQGLIKVVDQLFNQPPLSKP